MDIQLGIDPIIGVQSYTELPFDFRDYLEDLGISTLSQAQNVLLGQHSYWYTTDDLNIAGDWKVLWEEFTSNLEGARIRLNSCSDRLVWDYNHVNGSVIANLIYDSIVYASSPPIGCPLLALVWSGIMPLKISCFIWLTLENKILT